MAGDVANPLVDAGTQVGTPVATMGFGARESADETRQAQQSISNDAPTDVNPNAVVAREQASTLVLMGKNFEASAARMNAGMAMIQQILLGEFAKKPA